MDDYPIQSDIIDKITTIRMAAEMLRTFHDGTVDFMQNPDDIWFLEYKGELQKEVICHKPLSEKVYDMKTKQYRKYKKSADSGERKRREITFIKDNRYDWM